MGKIMLITASQSIENRLMSDVTKLAEDDIDLQAWVIPDDCTPKDFQNHIVEANADAYIIGSSMVNTLSSLVAAHTKRPVIGVPVNGDSSDVGNVILNTDGLPTGMPYGIVGVNRIKDACDFAKDLINKPLEM